MTENSSPSMKTRFRDSWEYKSVAFVLRMIAVLLFVSYLSIVLAGTSGWLEMKWVRFQDLNSLEAVAEKNLQRNTPEKLLKWISLRPKREHKAIMEKLTPYTGKVSSMTFLAYSKWMLDENDPDAAVFWRQYAQFRLRYDALRCGAPDGTKTMTGLLDLLPDDGVDLLLRKNPALVPKTIQEVLDFDARHPAENNPVDICPTIQNIDGGNFVMVAPEEWPAIRHTLRMMTEYALKEMREKK